MRADSRVVLNYLTVFLVGLALGRNWCAVLQSFTPEHDEYSETRGALNLQNSNHAHPELSDQTSTCEINQNLSDILSSQLPIGWERDDTRLWLDQLCPEVTDHFTRFPVYSQTREFHEELLPIQLTSYAAQAVCTIKMVKLLAASINARLYLHAGSHLGAVIHGQPIPWDDDVDMWMDFNKKQEFLEICQQYGETLLQAPVPIQLHCIVGHNALKVWLEYEGMKKETRDTAEYLSPYVDLFLFRIYSGQILEVSPGRGKIKKVAFDIEEYFPTRPFYFAGIYLFGPPSSLSETRYKLENCVMSAYTHRFERHLPKFNRCIDCHPLAKRFPFLQDNNRAIQAGNQLQAVFPSIGALLLPHSITNTSLAQRTEWFNASTSIGQDLTDALPHLNRVEVDNTIAPHEECQGKRLKVVVFNAERGKRWLEFATLLKEADVIILNEMDIGMARTDQQHTTRLLAYHLGMNYAWGLEFLELTLGTEEDRASINSTSEHNFYGLHGNAILTKCKISDPVIFRDPVGKYFSTKPMFENAQGMERRLGGRMMMLGRITIQAIIAGDQKPALCKEIGLDLITTNTSMYTWPASCSGFGRSKGDNMCSNLRVTQEAYAQKPCISQFGVNIELGDHALVWSELEVPWNMADKQFTTRIESKAK